MNNREAMQKAFEAFMANDEKFPDGCNMTERVFNAGYQAALASQQQYHIPDVGKMVQAQQTESRWMIPTESQILAATEKAGLWPNTVYTWLPAFHRYHAELAKLPPAPEGDK